MFGLDQTVGSRVVTRDADVADAISFGEDIEGGDVSGTVVRNDLDKHAPTTQDLSEYEIGNDGSGVGGGGAPFGIRSEGASRVDDISVGAGSRHKKGIDMNLAEEGGDNRDGRRDVEVVGLTDLALVARFDKPPDVLVEIGPPEAEKKVAARSKYSFVT